MEIGKKLKLVRSFTCHTQEVVSSTLNIPWETFRRYESDSRNIPHSQIIDICKFYGIGTFLLNAQDFSFIPYSTEGDIASLIIEGIKIGLIEANGEREIDGKRIAKGQAKLYFPLAIARQFRLTKTERKNNYLDTNLVTKDGKQYYALSFSNPDIEKMVCDWLLVWESGDIDKADRYQIEFAMNKTPLENPES